MTDDDGSPHGHARCVLSWCDAIGDGGAHHLITVHHDERELVVCRAGGQRYPTEMREVLVDDCPVLGNEVLQGI